jgi:hypothetical protein
LSHVVADTSHQQKNVESKNWIWISMWHDHDQGMGWGRIHIFSKQSGLEELNTIIKPRVCFCSLRNHTRVVLYLSYATKTTEKLLLILEFHTPSSPWHYADVATTSRRPVQQCMTEEIRTTTYVCIWYFYTTPGYHDSITGLHEIYHVGDSACSRINFARKGILVCVLTGYFCSDFANSEFVHWKSLISGMGWRNTERTEISYSALD